MRGAYLLFSLSGYPRVPFLFIAHIDTSISDRIALASSLVSQSHRAILYPHHTGDDRKIHEDKSARYRVSVECLGTVSDLKLTIFVY